jgi:diacylglycerol kinase (ATP)
MASSSPSAAVNASHRPPVSVRPDDMAGKMRLIFNARSGRFRRNAQLLPLLRNFIAARSLNAELLLTEGPGHATVLARDAVREGCGRVIAVGGDGTVNEVAQALRYTPAVLGIVPTGSGNGLARHLRLPGPAAAALELATAPHARVADLDTGAVNGRPFFNAMGLGLDAEISRRFNRLTRRGLPAYVRTALGAFLTSRTEPCVISAGGQSEAMEILLVAIANSDQYGNGARIAPGARADDGLLDLIAVGRVGPLGAAILGARLFLGSFDRGRQVKRLRGPRFRIERTAPGVIHTDGEVHSADAHLEVVVHPRSLRVVIP